MPNKSKLAMIVALSIFMVWLYNLSNLVVAEEPEPEVERKIVQKIISCVGDSITNGSSVNFTSSYPEVLQRHFDEKIFKVLNFGSNGQTVTKISDHSYWLEKEYETALQSNPKFVVFQFGTNDAKPSNWNESVFRLDYTHLIEQFQSLESHPVIFLCIPPPIYCPRKTSQNEESNTCWKYQSRSHVVNNLLPHIIADIAYKTGSALIDNFNLLGGERLTKPESFYEPGKLKEVEWTNKAPYDGIHPNEHGNELIATNLAWKLLEHMHKNMKIAKYFHNYRVIQNHDEVHNKAIIDSRNTSKHHSMKHEAVYSHIYDHMKNDLKVNENSTLMRPLIACVGDSLTEGMGTADPSSSAYPAVLQRHPGFHHYQVLNFGRSGTCVLKSDEDRSYWMTHQFTQAMRSQPHIVILQFGTNDILSQQWDETSFIADYSELIRMFQTMPSMPTVYINIPSPLYYKINTPVGDNATDQATVDNSNNFVKKALKKINTELPPIIRKIATLTNTVLIDLFSVMGGAELSRLDAFNDDLLHPNTLGYIIIGHEIAAAISKHENFTFIFPPRLEFEASFK